MLSDDEYEGITEYYLSAYQVNLGQYFNSKKAFDVSLNETFKKFNLTTEQQTEFMKRRISELTQCPV